MNSKRIIVALVLIVTLTLVVFIFEMPATQSKPHETVTTSVVAKKTTLQSIHIENPFIKHMLQEYEGEINALMKNSNTPGLAIAIVKDTSIIYLKGFGIKAIGSSDSVNTETVFRLGSVSKCFAPMLTGILVEDGKLSWDDKVIKYLPGFSLHSPEQTNNLSIKNVLSHTVGLPYHTYTNLIEDGIPLHDMLSKLHDVSMIGSVGKVYSYQNVAYSLISEVVEKASGISYEDGVTSKLFKPLRMNHASISFVDIKKNKNVALPHLHTRNGLRVIPISNTYYNVAPAGGVNASASDMALWIEALLGNRTTVIATNTLNEIYKPVIRAPSKNRNFRKFIRQTDSHYALGWRVLDFKTDTLLYHGGYVNGYRSELALDRRDKIGICILTNATGAAADMSAPIFFKLYLSHRDSIEQWERKHVNTELIVNR